MKPPARPKRARGKSGEQVAGQALVDSNRPDRIRQAVFPHIGRTADCCRGASTAGTMQEQTTPRLHLHLHFHTGLSSPHHTRLCPLFLLPSHAHAHARMLFRQRLHARGGLCNLYKATSAGPRYDSTGSRCDSRRQRQRALPSTMARVASPSGCGVVLPLLRRRGTRPGFHSFGPPGSSLRPVSPAIGWAPAGPDLRPLEEGFQSGGVVASMPLAHGLTIQIQ
jgi:hypothetical protein